MVQRIHKDAIALLDRATIDGQQVTFPQVDYEIYLKVKPVLLALGAPWNRSKKAHVFPDQVDPNALIQTVLAAGVMPEQNPLAYFATSSKVVDQMINRIRKLLPAFPFCSILEPEAGEGAIVERVSALIRSPVCEPRPSRQSVLKLIELDDFRFQKLQQQGYRVEQGDFLAMYPEEKVDAILMNPPFAVSGQPKAYIDHIVHAYENWLNAGGALVAIAPGGFSTNSDRQTVQFKAVVEAHGGWSALPEDSFAHANTRVSTVMLWMSK